MVKVFSLISPVGHTQVSLVDAVEHRKHCEISKIFELFQ